jgi:hypothetical protein
MDAQAIHASNAVHMLSSIEGNICPFACKPSAIQIENLV